MTLVRNLLLWAAVMVPAAALSQTRSMPQTTPGAGAPPTALPATFRGDLPCADCAGVRHHLDVWPDQVFHLRREWLGKNHVRHDLGRWRVDPGRRALVLYGGFEMPISLEIRGQDTLRQMDLQGRPIDSTLPYELKSDGTLAPTDLAMAFGGEVTVAGDDLRFTECLTWRTYRLSGGADLDKLRRAVEGALKEPGAPLYVTFEGTMPAPAGDEPVIAVDHFINVWPGQRCQRAMGQADLVNTYWRLVKLGGEAVAAVPGRREPHLLLRIGERRSYVATVGCNQLVGSFTSTRDTISFGNAAATMMACPPPLGDLERKLNQALGGARRWRVAGNTLELFDASGASTALFEATYL